MFHSGLAPGADPWRIKMEPVAVIAGKGNKRKLSSSVITLKGRDTLICASSLTVKELCDEVVSLQTELDECELLPDDEEEEVLLTNVSNSSYHVAKHLRAEVKKFGKREMNVSGEDGKVELTKDDEEKGEACFLADKNIVWFLLRMYPTQLMTGENDKDTASPELSGSTNLISHYNLDGAYSKFCGKKVKEKLSHFLPDLPGMIDNPASHDGSGLRLLLEKPPVVTKEFHPLTGSMLTGFRLHAGPLPEQYRALHQLPPRKKNKHRHKHNRTTDTLTQEGKEITSDSDHKKKKKKKDDDPERKKRKKEKKKKKIYRDRICQK
uniref:mediator of RNA polymerase II transcription subunit 19 n=1 Tax=Myxine glutinosa TaxID=7769 RepID=UPI00358EE7CE